MSPEAIIASDDGKDRTFATPILTTCALAGLVSWDEVPPLPFELAVLPHSGYRFVRLHVVSLCVAGVDRRSGSASTIDQRSRGTLTSRVLRARCCRKRSLKVLESIQPSSGGFLEATPLTSFVILSLAALRS